MTIALTGLLTFFIVLDVPMCSPALTYIGQISAATTWYADSRMSAMPKRDVLPLVPRTQVS